MPLQAQTAMRKCCQSEDRAPAFFIALQHLPIINRSWEAHINRKMSRDSKYPKVGVIIPAQPHIKTHCCEGHLCIRPVSLSGKQHLCCRLREGHHLKAKPFQDFQIQSLVVV